MVPSIRRAATALGDCAWLDAGRARAYARILLAVTLVGAAGWIALSPGGVDREGKPIGTDFVELLRRFPPGLDGSPAACLRRRRALGGAKGAVRPEARLYGVLLSRRPLS